MSHHRQHSHPGAGGGAGAHAHAHANEGFIEVKSKFDAEFRRFSLDRAKYNTFEKFERLLEELHLSGGADKDGGAGAGATPFVISYTDPKDNDQLPINNTDNYLRALQASRPLLRLVVQRQGEFDDTVVGGIAGGVGAGPFGAVAALHDRTHNKSIFNTMLGTPKQAKGGISISRPSEFRQVSLEMLLNPTNIASMNLTMNNELF